MNAFEILEDLKRMTYAKYPLPFLQTFTCSIYYTLYSYVKEARDLYFISVESLLNKNFENNNRNELYITLFECVLFTLSKQNFLNISFWVSIDS